MQHNELLLMFENFKEYLAFLFDLNGTMIDDMPFHIKAWHSVLSEAGVEVSLDQIKAECFGKNKEFLERLFPGLFSDSEKNEMSLAKEEQYQQAFKSQLQLIKGLHNFLNESHDAGIKIAIGTAAIMNNVDYVLDGVDIRHYIDTIVSADDVETSKPHPETFLKCAGILGIAPHRCLVFEDSPKGAETAFNAGMDCIIVTTLHNPEEFSTSKNVIGFISNFDDPLVKNLIKWKETV